MGKIIVPLVRLQFFFRKKIHKTTENCKKKPLQKSCQEYTFGFFKSQTGVFSRAPVDQMRLGSVAEDQVTSGKPRSGVE